ncbi:MAG: xylulose 5-phosphate 3-epimerase, partial [Hyphomonas sp.]|nr:xylulose 5-phosphate 3-epimerase [Hyphomonas sp.]
MNAFNKWVGGFGVIRHSEQTCERVRTLASSLVQTGRARSDEDVFEILAAADRLTSAAMWIVVHMTYARRVDMSGGALQAADFKQTPEGHTGGSLN